MALISTPSVNEPTRAAKQGPHFSPHSKAKANYKSINLRKIGSKWFKCCSVRFILLRENPYEEIDEYDNYCYNRKTIY